MERFPESTKPAGSRMNDPIADMLTRVRNASRALHSEVEIPHSKMKEGIAEVLKSEGFIKNYSVAGEMKRTLKIELKYLGRRPVISDLKRVSRPGLRHYVSSREIPRVLGGMGDSIVSTSKGVMNGAEARKRRVGGELVCYVW